MFDSVLIRRNGRFFRVPGLLWRRTVRAEARRMRRRLGFMNRDHHRVRDFAVSEIARSGRPVSPAQVAAGAGLPESRVVPILDELERNMTFLFRRDGLRVDWAYPVTTERTPHRVCLDSGERFFGA